MTATKQNLPRWFKSQPQQLQSSKIDREAGIIHDVVMCQAGPAKGHGIWLEEEFINDLVAYDKKHFSDSGLKCRFGHPSMSDTTMGSQMGVFKNFRKRGDQAIADLHLLDSADQSPKYPQMREWMLSMADERPDFVMMSIVYRPGAYYQRDKNGNKRYCYYYEEYEDEDGETSIRWVQPSSSLGNVFSEFGEKGEHFYTDAVEAGAATDSLFSNQFNQDKFAVQASDWLQEHPDILSFLKDNPNKLIEFAGKCGIDIHQPKQASSLKERWMSFRNFLLGDEIEGEELEVEDSGLVQELEGQLAEWKQQANSYQDRITELEAQLAEAQAAMAEQAARIEELSKQPAADETTGQLETELGPKARPSFQDSPVNRKAREMYQRTQKAKQQ